MSTAGEILLVDDDFDIRDAVKDILEDEGYGVVTAGDGLEALAYLRSHGTHPPAVILLDWMMPRCDGATFREEQLKDDRLAGIPIVLLTADAQVDAKALRLRASDHLPKPTDLKRLLDVVGRFCDPR